MTAASTGSIIAVGVGVWAAASLILGSIAGKVIADANADDCGLATDDSEWCLECEGPCRFEGEL